MLRRPSASRRHSTYRQGSTADIYKAIASLSNAHRIYLAQGHLLGQAVTLKYLGQAQSSAGRADQARESLEAALVLFGGMRAETEAEAVRSALAELAQPCAVPKTRA